MIMMVAGVPTHSAVQPAAAAAQTTRKADGTGHTAPGRVAGLVVCRVAAFMLGLGGVQALVEAARRDPEVRKWE